MKRVRAGSTWVQVTVVPTGLGFTANGEPVTWCDNSGVVLMQENLNRIHQFQGKIPFVHDAAGGCSKRFATTSPGLPDQPVAATMQIRWRISWVGSGNTSGSLPDMVTSSTTQPFAITEAQTLVTK